MFNKSASTSNQPMTQSTTQSMTQSMTQQEHNLFTKLLCVIKKINCQMRKIETLRVEIISLVPTITCDESRIQMLKLYSFIQMENEKLYNLIQEGMELERREAEDSGAHISPASSNVENVIKAEQHFRQPDYEKLLNRSSGRLNSSCGCGPDIGCPRSRMNFSPSSDRPRTTTFRPLNNQQQQDSWYEPSAATFSKSSFRFRNPNTMASQINMGISEATLKNYNRNGSALAGSKSSTNILECLRKNKICDVSDIKVLDDVNYLLKSDRMSARPGTSQMRSSRSNADFFGALARRIASQTGKMNELLGDIDKDRTDSPSSSPTKK